MTQTPLLSQSYRLSSLLYDGFFLKYPFLPLISSVSTNLQPIFTIYQIIQLSTSLFLLKSRDFYSSADWDFSNWHGLVYPIGKEPRTRDT